MPNDFSRIDLSRINQIRRFKIDYREVKNLQLIDKERNMKLQTFTEFKAIAGIHLAVNAVGVARPDFPADLGYLKNYSALHFPKGKMLVIVNYDLYPSVENAVSRYVQDLAYEGYYAEVYRYRNGTPTQLRNFIIGKMPVKGVLFVGNLPVAWFEMNNDFDNTTSEFPCDLYYMDTNGTWQDPDGDGKFSVHATNVQPEIWVGRLWTPDQNGNNATMINDYFNRNHQFRKGLGGYSNRALAYVDDDWVGFDDCAFDLMFPPANIEVIKDPATTDGDRYKIEINEHRGWAQICAHSSPNGHSFKIPGGSEWIPNTYLRDDNPPNAYFYNLFACSNARFTQAEYMGGWYIFDKPGGFGSNGLVAVGSTKTGSMLMFENFYGPMAAGKEVGDAFVAWWNGLGATHELGEIQWYYGMVLLGDPTINWWSGVVPTLTQPFNNQTFGHYPRKTIFRWNNIILSNAAVSYYIEIDAFGAREAGKWSAETGRTWLVSGPLPTPVYEHFFVGAQRGRWRVRAKAGSIMCPWSDWKYFRYTI